jgi:hypothetical protein
MTESPSENERKRDEATSPTPDFAAVGKRVSRFATNLLVSAVILLLALVVGRQMIEWWRTSPESISNQLPPSDSRPLLGDPARPHWLRIGDLPETFSRRELTGTAEEALEQLCEHCRGAVQNAILPTGPVAPHEARLLAQTRRLPPVESEPGRWSLYQRQGPVLMVVAVCAIADENSLSDDREVVDPGVRVVSWGLGFPGVSGDPEAKIRSWTLLTCDTATESNGGVKSLLATLPVPPNARRTLALAVDDGGGRIGFVGDGSTSAWREFYDDWFARNDWSTESTWRAAGVVWHARFRNPRLGRVDAQIFADETNGNAGMLVITPPSAAENMEK